MTTSPPLAGFYLCAGLAGGLLGASLLIGREDATRSEPAARPAATLTLLGLVLLGLWYLVDGSAEHRPAAATVALATSATLPAFLRGDRRRLRSVAGCAALTALAAASAVLDGTSGSFLLHAARTWALLASSVAMGCVVLSLGERHRVDAEVDLARARSLWRLGATALVLEAIGLVVLIAGSPEPRAYLGAPDGYQFVLGGCGLGIAAPFLLALSPSPLLALCRDLAVVAGGLALRRVLFG